MVIAHSNLYWARAAYPNGTGVLVLAGSSGRVDVERANMLASQGVTALALRWFGGEAQPSVPCETPLETFAEAIGMMTVECQHLVLLGSSYGAEAALLTASMDGRVDAAIAMAPTDVVWQGGARGREGGDHNPAKQVDAGREACRLRTARPGVAASVTRARICDR
jgi:dienelactone hydrolase